MARAIPHLENNDGNVWKISLAVAILLALMISFIPATKVAVEPEQILEPITVKITETQKAVRVPVTASLMDVPPQLQKQAKEVRQAVQQNLGFLGFLGKKT